MKRPIVVALALILSACEYQTRHYEVRRSGESTLCLTRDTLVGEAWDATAGCVRFRDARTGERNVFCGTVSVERVASCPAEVAR